MNKDKLIFISYFMGVKGNCPAEWADDKLRALNKTSTNIFVITSIQSKIRNYKNIKYFRVPSLSYSNFKYELEIFKKNNNNKIPLFLKFFYLLSLSFGSLFDLIMRLTVKSLTGSYWSWFIVAFPITLIIKFKYRINKIFTTGGPSSAHLLGTFIAFLVSGTNCICEHQDPIIGTYIKNKTSRKIAFILDRFYTRYASKIIYVTKKAAKSAIQRNPKQGYKIHSIYPGSWNFFKFKKNQNRNNEDIEFLHLGTLYGTRNLDNLFSAIDYLKENNKDDKVIQSIKIVNCGDIYLDNKDDYLNRNDFELIRCKSRKDALIRASKSNYLLLVQHIDKRSQETIPYKFYDYLNLNIPIFAICNNNELEKLVLKSGGIISKASKTKSIIKSIRSLLDKKNISPFLNKSKLKFDIQEQLSKAID